MPRLYLAPADLRRWRLARAYGDPRWTQEFAAQFFGVSVRTFRRYEHGDSPVPQWLVRRIVRLRLTPIQRAHLKRTATGGQPPSGLV